MDKMRVVLDYGHGGSKSGAVSGGIEEKTLNMLAGNSIYNELHRLSMDREIQVMLTRNADYDMPLSARYRLINAHNEEKEVDLVMSVHHNAAVIATASGFEVYYHEDSTKGFSAAQKVINSVRGSSIPVRGEGAITTATLGRNLAMIHKTIPPSILIEIGYMTNLVDRSNMIDPGFRSKVARSVAEGIWNYLEPEYKDD